ncbi:MAG: GNAT family N-acetyltransferase [Burkholderiaceae bacterium]
MSAIMIRQLLVDDVGPYRALRLRALREFPQAFTSSHAEESGKPLEWSERRLEPDAQRPHDVFMGAFESGDLCAMAGLQGRYRAKERHNATVVGMYVAPQCAGKGIGAALMQGLIARARSMPELEQIDLTVTGGNGNAEALYRRCGFVEYGRLERAVRVDGEYYAKVHMVLVLR